MTGKPWIAGIDGKNIKFKHETLLNYAMNRWALNKAHSVGKTSELIRNCAPKFLKLGRNTTSKQLIKTKGMGQKLHESISKAWDKGSM